MTLNDLPTAKRTRIEEQLREILPVCDSASLEEMGWIASACLRFLVLKIEQSERIADKILPNEETA